MSALEARHLTGAVSHVGVSLARVALTLLDGPRSSVPAPTPTPDETWRGRGKPPLRRAHAGLERERTGVPRDDRPLRLVGGRLVAGGADEVGRVRQMCPDRVPSFALNLVKITSVLPGERARRIVRPDVREEQQDLGLQLPMGLRNPWTCRCLHDETVHLGMRPRCCEPVS